MLKCIFNTSRPVVSQQIVDWLTNRARLNGRNDLARTCMTQKAECWTAVQTFDSCPSRPDVGRCSVVETPMNSTSKNKPSPSMTHVACESKLSSYAWSFMPRKLVDNREYRPVRTLRVRIKWRHCTLCCGR